MACGINATLVSINIMMLLLGICADPGVPPQIYRRYTKAKYGRQFKQQQKQSIGNDSGQSKYIELETRNEFFDIDIEMKETKGGSDNKKASNNKK